jgi:hypothetical protein
LFGGFGSAAGLSLGRTGLPSEGVSAGGAPAAIRARFRGSGFFLPGRRCPEDRASAARLT